MAINSSGDMLPFGGSKTRSDPLLVKHSDFSCEAAAVRDAEASKRPFLSAHRSVSYIYEGQSPSEPSDTATKTSSDGQRSCSVE
jgi:hypothetical protein